MPSKHATLFCVVIKSNHADVHVRACENPVAIAFSKENVTNFLDAVQDFAIYSPRIACVASKPARSQCFSFNRISSPLRTSSSIDLLRLALDRRKFVGTIRNSRVRVHPTADLCREMVDCSTITSALGHAALVIHTNFTAALRLCRSNRSAHRSLRSQLRLSSATAMCSSLLLRGNRRRFAKDSFTSASSFSKLVQDLARPVLRHC